MKKYLLCSAVIYLDSVVNAGTDYAVRRVVKGDSSHLIFAFQVIDWAPFFRCLIYYEVYLKMAQNCCDRDRVA